VGNHCDDLCDVEQSLLGTRYVNQLDLGTHFIVVVVVVSRTPQRGKALLGCGLHSCWIMLFQKIQKVPAPDV
jgi:hypothetical protein